MAPSELHCLVAVAVAMAMVAEAVAEETPALVSQHQHFLPMKVMTA